MKQIFYFIIILIVVTAPGQFVGEHVYCFTSGNFDVRKFLNNPGQENELVIGVGTMNNLPDKVIWGIWT